MNQDSIESHTTTEKNAGRIKKRICRKILDLSWLEGQTKWPGLQTIFSIERITDVRGHHREETSYYISSVDAPSKQLMRIARKHWKIESLHWQLDVTFQEDTYRFLEENAHKTFNALRGYALVVHKQLLSATGKKASMKANMLACLLNHSILLQLFKNL